MRNYAPPDPDLTLYVTTNELVETQRGRRKSISQHECGLVYHFDQSTRLLCPCNRAGAAGSGNSGEPRNKMMPR